jgi:hypothetical protein
MADPSNTPPAPAPSTASAGVPPKEKEPKQRKPRRGSGNAYDHQRAGRRFFGIVAGVLVFFALVYLTARLAWPPKLMTHGALDFVELNHLRQVTIQSAEDIEWFVGKEKALPLLAQMDERNQQIAETHARAVQRMTELASRLDAGLSDEASAVLLALERGRRNELPRLRPRASVRDAIRRLRETLGCRGHCAGRVRCQCGSDGDPQPSRTAACKDCSPPECRCDEDAAPTGGRARADGEPFDDVSRLLASLESFHRLLTNQFVAPREWMQWHETIHTNVSARLSNLVTTLKALEAAANLPSATTNASSAALTNLADQVRAVRAGLESVSHVLLAPPDFPSTATNAALIGQLQQTAGELRQLYRPPQSPPVLFAAFSQRLTDDDRASIGLPLLFEIQRLLERLESLQADQWRTVLALQRPEKFNLFWCTPAGSFWEVIFWTIFGVCANLLYHTAQALRRKEFSPVERSVGYAKLLYGPAVSVALALALVNGLASLMGDEVRVWSLPLLGFLFGYNARKAAQVVDHLSETVLNRLRGSVAKPAAERLAAERGARREIQTAVKPITSVAEFAAEAQREAGKALHRVVARLDRKAST